MFYKLNIFYNQQNCMEKKKDISIGTKL